MANHRSPKPGLQVRLLPLLCFPYRRQESRGAATVQGEARRRGGPTSLGAAAGRPGANEVSGGRRLLPLLRFPCGQQEFPPKADPPLAGKEALENSAKWKVEH